MTTLTLAEFKEQTEKKVSNLQIEIQKIQERASLVDYLEEQLAVPIFVRENPLYPNQDHEFQIRDYAKATNVELKLYDRREQGLNQLEYEVVFKADDVKTPEGAGIPIYCCYESWENDFHTARFIQRYIIEDDSSEAEDNSEFYVKVEFLCTYYLQLGVKEDLVAELRTKLETAYKASLPTIAEKLAE